MVRKVEYRLLQSYKHIVHCCYAIGTQCPIEGQEYTECGTACPPTCGAIDPVPCTLQCVAGCQCPSGTVLDEENKRCVEHNLCPIPPCGKEMTVAP